MATKVVLWITVIVLSFFWGYNIYKNDLEQNRLNAKIDYIESENRLLRDKNHFVQKQPTYEDGYKDCLIHMSGGNGSFKKGFDAAIKLMNNQDYASGYHAAIKQFEYFGEMLVPPPEVTKTTKDSSGICPAHFGGQKK